MKLSSGILMGIFALSTVPVLAGPFDDWDKYRTITVNTTNSGGGANVTATLQDFPLLVRLSDADAASGADVLSEALAGGADLRFTTGDGGIAIPYEIEQWSGSAAAIWVRVPSVAGNANTTIRMYWGKSDATSESDGAAVFNASNGYLAVFHLNEAAGDTIRDVTGNYIGVPAGPSNPANVPPGTGATDALIGNAKSFGGVVNTGAAGTSHLTAGGGYRILTAAGGGTGSHFDFSGNSPLFTISAWYNMAAMPGAGGASNDFFHNNRRGILTKADHAPSGADPEPRSWYLRNNTVAGGVVP
jgi:hypothetical protein